ncbi:MAG TPA: CotH kinase family protein, partial [Firmicutes bacterium]|nr:CotH kinase family protein [Bacillota bacterium]
YAPNVRFCEVILNGEYKGLYLMTETLTNGENCRLDISEPIEGTGKTGYLLRLDRGSTEPIKNIETFTNYAYRNLQVVDIKYPRSQSLTQEMVDEIVREFSAFEKALYSYDYDTLDYGYSHNIDVESFVDYYIINEFTTNYDAGWLSTYIYKDIGGKYRMVIWDFNSACDNYRDPVTSPQHIELQHNVWYFMLTKDEYFTDRIIRRYRALRQTFLSEEYLYRYIDDTVAYLGDAVERNFAVWGYTFDLDLRQPEERNPRSFAEAIAQLKTFIQERGQWLDDHIEIIRQYSHASKNKKFNH